MNLGTFIPIADASGNFIGYYDDQTGATQVADPADQPLADQIAGDMWAAQGYAAAPDPNASAGGASGSWGSGFGFDKPTGIIDYAGLVPPSDPIAAGIDPNKLITAAGTVYRYVRSVSPTTGVVSYNPQPYNAAAGGLFGLSPMMLLGIGVLGFMMLKK